MLMSSRSDFETMKLGLFNRSSQQEQERQVEQDE